MAEIWESQFSAALTSDSAEWLEVKESVDMAMREFDAESLNDALGKASNFMSSFNRARKSDHKAAELFFSIHVVKLSNMAMQNSYDTSKPESVRNIASQIA